MQTIVETAKSAFEAFFMETAYISRVYADSLRDNFVGYVPIDQAKFDTLRDEFELETATGRPDFAKLLRIESGLVEILPASLVLARFWAVEDRFQRVVPTGTRAVYQASVKPRGDPIWDDAEFVRTQTRSLLDSVHANYLINIGREKSIGRLKAILAVTFVGAIVAATTVASAHPLWSGYVLLALAGIFGAVLSIANRLQTAVSRDAMTEDGIAEVYGLRTGWAGVLVSVFLGGGFALVLYGVVMAGMLGLASPDRVGDPAKPGQFESAAPPAQPIDATQASWSHGDAEFRLVADAGQMPAPTNDAGQAPAPDDAVTPRRRDDCVSGSEPNCTVTRRLTSSLGLKDNSDLFKMLILALLAGFAERLAPDILNRLSKHAAR